MNFFKFPDLNIYPSIQNFLHIVNLFLYLQSKTIYLVNLPFLSASSSIPTLAFSDLIN